MKNNEGKPLKRDRRVVSVRRSAETFFEIARQLPTEFVQSICAITERLDPWEDWALEMEQREQDLHFLMEVIEAEDLVNAAFMNQVNAAGSSAAEHAVHVIAQLRRNTNKGINKICKDAVAPIKRFLQTVQRGRPLTTHFLDDVDYAFLEQIFVIMRSAVEDPFMLERNLIEDGGASTSVACSLQFARAMDSEHFVLDDAEEVRKSDVELYKRLRGSDFVSSGRSNSFTLPLPERAHAPLKVKLTFDRAHNALSIARCSIMRGDVSLIGHLSRVSGEVCPLQTSIRSFESVLGPGLYEYVRHAVLQWIEVLYENGEIEEEELFSSNELVPPLPEEPSYIIPTTSLGDSEAAEEETPPVEVLTVEAPVQVVIENAKTDDEKSKQFITTADVTSPADISSPIVALPTTGPVTATPQEQPRSTLRLPKHIRYRDALSALHRSGVSMRPGTRHGYVLRHGEKTATFYNPHSVDPAENRRILRRIIRQLGIEEEFILHLNQRGAKSQRKRAIGL